jgi:hypothetical protein
MLCVSLIKVASTERGTLPTSWWRPPEQWCHILVLLAREVLVLGPAHAPVPRPVAQVLLDQTQIPSDNGNRAVPVKNLSLAFRRSSLDICPVGGSTVAGCTAYVTCHTHFERLRTSIAIQNSRSMELVALSRPSSGGCAVGNSNPAWIVTSWLPLRWLRFHATWRPHLPGRWCLIWRCAWHPAYAPRGWSSGHGFRQRTH